MSHPEKITELQIEGMTCAHCAGTITKILEKHGAANAHVSFATGEARFTLEDQKEIPGIVADINQSGYKVLENQAAQPEAKGLGALSKVEWFYVITFPFSMLLLVSHMILPHEHLLNSPEIQLGLCVPVYLIGLYWFGKSAWKSVTLMAPNMDVLIIIGASAAFIYSVAGMMIYGDSHEVHQYIFFETSAMIINLVLLGNVLEHRSVKQTTTALKELNKLKPERAKKVLLDQGKETIVEVDADKIKVGDIVLVNMGDRIPADGKVMSGDGSVDESMITGESIPVEKESGSLVTGGTLMAAGNLYMQVERSGTESTLSRIIELVKQAELHKPALQRLGDKISNIFVPVVISIAVATFLAAYYFFHLSFSVSIMNAIAVLVIACPCAMGLATPTAVMVGIGRAARNGILIKGGDSLEKMARIQSVIFDKTGTLTTGKFKIAQFEITGDASVEELEQVLYSLEQRSSHPIAQSIVAELSAKGVKAILFSGITEIKGRGIEGLTASGDKYQVGSYRLLDENYPDKSHAIYILKNEKVVGFLDLQDEIRKGAGELIAFLHKQGIKTVLLSGDSRSRCENVAVQIGIKEIVPEQLPEEKLNYVTELNKSMLTVMVGDGVNDAPALARASLGVSIGRATDAAIQSSQVILLNDNDLTQFIKAYNMSRATLKTIKQNLFWAFFYNVLAIPLAAAGMLKPIMAALIMALSDVVVIGNSILLRFKKIK